MKLRARDGALATHPVTCFLPPPSRQERAALRASLQREGLRNALIVSEGRLLDGQARLALCHRLSISPVFEEVGGLSDVEALLLFLAVNSERLDALTPPQRAAWAARAMPLFSAEGKTAQQAGARKGGSVSKARRQAQPDHADAPTAHEESGKVIIAEAARAAARNVIAQNSASTARSRVAQAFHVSSGYVGLAREVGITDQGLLDLVAQGVISLEEAKSQARSLVNERQNAVEKSGYREMLRLQPDGRTVASLTLEFDNPLDATLVLAQLHGNPLVKVFTPLAQEASRVTKRERPG